MVASAGIEASIHEITVDSIEEVERLKMARSPTILINGDDAVAAFEPPSMSCRLYLTEGGFQGAPSVADLMLALR